MKKSNLKKILDYSLAQYMYEVEETTRATFCDSCMDQKPNCFPCPMSRTASEEILPMVISKHAWLN
jgi:hypothetical protein